MRISARWWPLKPGRERDDERILVHTTGMVSHDIGIAWNIYKQAKAQGLYRLEGKPYIVQDGDILNIRFSV